MAHDVFVSFKSENQEVAEKICDDLASKGIKCWISSRDIRSGEAFQTAIAVALKEAAVMVLIFSSSANESEEILKEVTMAGKNRKLILPVRIEDFIPTAAFEYELSNRQYIDLFKGWEKEIEHLAKDIQYHISNLSGKGTGQPKSTIQEATLVLPNKESQTTGSPEVSYIQSDATKEIATWPDVGITFLMDFKKRFDPTGLPFKPVEISSDEEISEELEIAWFIDDTYYFAVWLTGKRSDKVDLRWGYYSTFEKRDPLFRKRSDAFYLNKIWLNDDGDVLIDGDKYYFNSEEGYLGFETSQKRTISSLSDPALVEVVANKMKVFSQSVWPIIVANSEK